MDFLNCFIIWDKFVNVKFIFYYNHENTNLFKNIVLIILKKCFSTKYLHIRSLELYSIQIALINLQKQIKKLQDNLFLGINLNKKIISDNIAKYTLDTYID